MNFSAIEKRSDSQDTCTICQESFAETFQKKRIEITCHHLYHESCIKQWELHNPICPLCRKKFKILNYWQQIRHSTIQGALLGTAYLTVSISQSFFQTNSTLFGQSCSDGLFSEQEKFLASALPFGINAALLKNTAFIICGGAMWGFINGNLDYLSDRLMT
ncbi:RING finger domain-containing protein [Candidatus Protochlamydia phocaeensis]|uniref:RING finger domain-containing protein n=1 Tax=Candidatus Protochlamydia phocaeensis TaxID=1414722 RepID=UPI000838FBF6|nr:RING finger domain-containing protein [Candidatus Protochlamydia phocaeensis]